MWLFSNNASLLCSGNSRQLTQGDSTMRKCKSRALPAAIAAALMLNGGSAVIADTVVKHTGPLKWETNEGEFKLQVGGRIMADAAFYDEDNVELDGESGTEFRRARLFVAGTMFHDWDWKAQYDFAGNGTEIKDAYIRYTGFDWGKITVGQFKQPFGLEELTSSKYITFMERAMATNAFSTSRRIGLGLNGGSDSWTWAASVYGQEESDDPSSGDEAYGAGARVTWAPWHEKTRVLHLGAAAAWEDPNDDGLRFRARPESHITSTRMVDTGSFDNPDSFTKYGLEAATVLGPFSLQGEYMMVNAEEDLPGADDADFTGAYVYGSWFITGESRNYKKGKFGRVKPKSVVGKGGHGAWELAARYSTIDLEDGDFEGGEEDNITIGLNWYATPYIRFMANYVMTDTDPTSRSIRDDQDVDDDELSVFQLRAQIDF
jgi:phosphate-selective porin OprO/OprP